MLGTFKARIKGLLYRPSGVQMGAGSMIRRPFTISNPRHVQIGARTLIGRRVILNAIRNYRSSPHHGEISIGDDVYVGHDCQLHAMQALRIGNGCVLSDRVYINDASHGMDPHAGLIMAQRIHSKGEIHLEDHVFLGLGAVILPGVRLGSHCVVAAQSVVTRSYPPGTMLAGNPARPIKTLDASTGIWHSTRRAPAERGQP